jgi:endo-1,4-beta-xylanase
MQYFQRVLALTLISLGLTACGGGGGGGSKPVPPKSANSIASSTPISSVVAVSSVAVSSSIPTTSSSSSAAASVYSANVDSLHTLATFPIGIAVSNTDSSAYNILTNASEWAVVEKHFDQMTAGNIMKMRSLHPKLDEFNFINADAFVAYAKSKNISVHGHTLVWHSAYQVPDFMKNWQGTKDAFLAALDTHVTTIVNHFKTAGNVNSWDVVNEALSDNSPWGFRTDSVFYIKSGNSEVYIEKAFQAARLADPAATLYYNDYSIEKNETKTSKLIEMITDFKARSIPLDGIGFQMHVFLDYPSIDNISAAMQKVVEQGLKVKITELDVAINNPYSKDWPANKVSSFSEPLALAQKKRYCDIVKAYLETVPVELRGGITVWGTTDAHTWLDDFPQYNGEKITWPLLFDGNYNDKPALRGFADALEGAACTNL